MSDRPDLIQEPWKITGAGLFMRSKGKNMTGGRRKRDCVFVAGGGTRVYLKNSAQVKLLAGLETSLSFLTCPYGQSDQSP